MMNASYMPVRPAKTHQIIARQILMNLIQQLNGNEWEPIQGVALRDDDDKSLSADVTIFDKEENAKVCIEIFKKPFSDNAKIRRYQQLIDYYPDLEEIFFVVYKPLLEFFDYQIEGWYKITPKNDTLETTNYSDSLKIHLSL